VAPTVPSRPCASGEQLDLRQVGVHALDDFVGAVGLAAMLAGARGLEHRRWAQMLRGRWHVAARGQEEVLVLLPEVVAAAVAAPVSFDPHRARLGDEAPGANHLKGLFEDRRGDPEKEYCDRRGDLDYGQRLDLIKRHCLVMVLDGAVARCRE